MDNNYYILKGKDFKKASFKEYCSCWLKNGSSLKQTYFENNIKISTIFLGINHGYDNDIILFETMIFGGKRDEEMYRYRGYDEAIKGHDKIVKEFLELGLKISKTVSNELAPNIPFSRFQIMDI